MLASLASKVAEVFDEPGCEHNRKKSEQERKDGCARAARPGAAAGGCALDGAKIALQPIADAAHLVHGPIGCEGNAWDNRSAKSSHSSLYRMGFTTDLREQDVIMGGEQRLFRAIEEIVAKYDPAAVFVYQTCVTALIGDDLAAVCREAAGKLGKPVVPVYSAGFVGSKNLGNKLAGEALLDHVIGTVEPDDTTPYDVNIVGEYNLSGEFWQVQPLFDGLGIRVLACITGNARYREVARSHRARVTMVVCSTAMINVARKLRERYGIPYFEGSFYGIADTSNSLRQIARLLVEQGAPPELRGRTEALIEAEEARAWEQLAVYRERLRGKRVLLATGGVKSWSLVSALQELGMDVVATSVKKSTSEDKERIKALLGEDAPMTDELPQREVYALLKAGRADILMAGGRSQFVALKARMPFVDVNQERHHAYAVYAGMVELAAQIDQALFSPIWAQVRRPAVWESDGRDRPRWLPNREVARGQERLAAVAAQ